IDAVTGAHATIRERRVVDVPVEHLAIEGFESAGIAGGDLPVDDRLTHDAHSCCSGRSGPTADCDAARVDSCTAGAGSCGHDPRGAPKFTPRSTCCKGLAPHSVSGFLRWISNPFERKPRPPGSRSPRITRPVWTVSWSSDRPGHTPIGPKYSLWESALPKATRPTGAGRTRRVPGSRSTTVLFATWRRRTTTSTGRRRSGRRSPTSCAITWSLSPIPTSSATWTTRWTRISNVTTV